MKKLLSSIVITILLFAVSLGDNISITVYNDNFGLVKQTRNIEFPKGISEIRFDDVAAQIDPTSVHILAPGISIRTELSVRLSQYSEDHAKVSGDRNQPGDQRRRYSSGRSSFIR